MNIIQKKTSADDSLVLVVDAYSLPNDGLTRAVDQVGVILRFSGESYEVIRVGKPFRVGRNDKHIYFYVKPSESAAENCDAAAQVEANKKSRLDAEFVARCDRKAPSVESFAPSGWKGGLR